MLQKLKKKNYLKSSSFRSIILFDTLNKMLKSIILKRLRYVAKAHSILLNTQIKIKRQRLIDTILQEYFEIINL